eukprot:403368264
MMRKYGLDETQIYVEQSTLLEPNNFIPSWEAGDEEKKEVSNALKKLRTKYDAIHKMVIEKTNQLDLIKKGVEKIGQEEHKVEQDTGGTHQETLDAKKELSEITETHEFEQLFQGQYQHMLDRMKKDLISLQLTSNDLTESLKSKKIIINDELNKQRKSKENKLQSKYRLDNLMKNIDHEQKKRQERILSLQTSIRNKEEALQKRMDRVRRQSEIAEAAANENKDSNEIKLRENFMIQRMWSQFYKRKMNNEMKKSHQIEEAFQAIRTATGCTDVQEIVQKFLTKEQTYAQLLKAVSENEKRLDKLRIDNEKKRDELHQLQINLNQIANSRERSKSQPAPVIQNATSQEITELEKEIEILEKEVQNNDDRKKKIYLVTDQVSGWGNRVVNKLNSQILGQDNTPIQKKLPILSLFNQITDIVCQQLEDIIQQQELEDQDTGFITAKDFMNDFATEEFLTKNIRVRPVSGITHKDGDDKSEHISRGNLLDNMSVGGGDDEEKFNKMVNLEMEDQRKRIKVQREEIERKKHIAEEKKEKAAKKKQ